MAALSSGHLATDFANGALPALLPFFVDKFELSYTLAAAVVLASAVSSAIGPPLVLAFGLAGGLLLALPCLAVAVTLLLLAPFLGSFAPDNGRQIQTDEPDRLGALMLLLGVIAFRSVAWFGLITFVPLWEVSLGHSKAHGNHLLSLMLLAGGVGTLAAGPLADRFGRRPVLLVCSAATAPLILVFVIVGGVPGAIALAGVGISVIATFGVTMVMSQEYLPRHIRTGSRLSICLSIGLGGVGAVALGAVADSIDLRAAMYVTAVAALVALVLAGLLPSSRSSRRLAAEPVAP